MNAFNTTSRTAELQLAPRSGIKLATCAALSLIITLLSASVIGQATGARSVSSSLSSGPALTASLR
jgi:hypothetical protein